VRTPAELDSVDALVLPGGESTTMSRLLQVFDLEMPLRQRLAAGMPTLSTCAGLILMSREVLDGRPDQIAFGILDVSVRRNGYGRQVESFEAELDVTGLKGRSFPGVFIRSPLVESTGSAEVIARHGGHAVAVRQGRIVALCFHPELTGDLRLHREFVKLAAS